METFTALLRQIGQVFTWWVMVAPWEQGLRVRLGKYVSRLNAGVHLKIPFIDTAFVQSVRLRVAHLSMQTVMSKDRQPLTVAGSLAFSVENIETLYQTLHHAQDTIMQLAAVALADAAADLDRSELTPTVLAAAATARLQTHDFGLKDLSVRVTDFAFIKTYRFVMDQKWGSYGQQLDVEKKDG